MWSLYVGRPCGIGIENISISRPSREQNQLTSKTWEPLPEVPYDSENSTQAIHDPIEACADANVSLCVMMRQLSKNMYVSKFVSQLVLCRKLNFQQLLFEASLRSQTSTFCGKHACWLLIMGKESSIGIEHQSLWWNKAVPTPHHSAAVWLLNFTRKCLKLNLIVCNFTLFRYSSIDPSSRVPLQTHKTFLKLMLMIHAQSAFRLHNLS